MKISHQGGGIQVTSNLISVGSAMEVYCVFSTRALPSSRGAQSRPMVIAGVVLEASGASLTNTL